MSEQVDVQEIPEVQKKWRKEYQPTDANGDSIGAPQVFEADSQDELIDKLANAHMHATAAINKLTRTEKLIQAANSEEAPLKPRELSADEVFELSNDLIEPTKRASAIKRIYAAAQGESPEETQARIQRLEADREMAVAKSFCYTHPDYVVCDENARAVMGYIQRHKMAVTEENLELAYQELKGAGLLSLKPAPVKVEEAAEAEAEPSRITPPPPATRSRQVATGLRPGQSSAVPDAQKKPGLTREELAAMPAREYEQRMRDPAFRRIVDELMQRGKR